MNKNILFGLIIVGLMLVSGCNNNEQLIQECKDDHQRLYESFIDNWDTMIEWTEFEKTILEYKGVLTKEIENDLNEDIKKIEFHKKVDRERRDYYFRECEKL